MFTTEVVEAEGVEPSCWSKSNRATTCVVRVLSWSPAPAPTDRIVGWLPPGWFPRCNPRRYRATASLRLTSHQP